MGEDVPKYSLTGLRGELTNTKPRDLSLQWVEMIYREHAAVKDIVVFGDQFGQLVALAVSEDASEDDLRCVLDEIASQPLPGYAHVVDFVSLQPNDPLVSAWFTAIGSPCRDLIWQFLVGSIETLTSAGYRLSPTVQRQFRSQRESRRRTIVMHIRAAEGLMPSPTDPAARVSGMDVTALRILARSIVRELLKTRGYGLRHIIALASELIGLACESIRACRTPTIGT
jgi:hypothetical protein